MGSIYPCLVRDPSEKALTEKEEKMMINKFSTMQLKDVELIFLNFFLKSFFYLNFGETITYANVIKGMEILTAKNSSATGLYKEGEASEAKKILNQLLKAFIDGQEQQKIEDNTFKFKDLMIIFMILSDSLTKDKVILNYHLYFAQIAGILSLEKKEKFNFEDLCNVFKNVFKIVLDSSLQLSLYGLEDEAKKTLEKDKFKHFQEKVNTAVETSVEKIIKPGVEKTSSEIGMTFQLATMQYDAGTTYGKILRDLDKKNETEEKKENQKSDVKPSDKPQEKAPVTEVKPESKQEKQATKS